MADAGGLSTLVANPEARSQPRLSAVEREAAERQRDRARREQGMQTLEARPAGSEEWAETYRQIWEAVKNMPWYDQAAISTALIPGIGDFVGFGADAITLVKDPSLANLGYMGAGLLPWVPAGSVIKTARKLEAQLPKYPGKSRVEKRLKSRPQIGKEVQEDTPILPGTAQRIFTNLRNDIPGFYEGGLGRVGKLARFGRTLPEGLSNAYLARYHPQWRAIQREHNISVADQRAARNALRVTDEKTAEIARIENKIAEMEEIGSAYTGKIKTRKTGKKEGKQTPILTAEHKKLSEERTKLKAQAHQAAKIAMGQLNQSRSMTKQYLGHDSGLEGLLEHINKVDHVENFKNFEVDNYWETVGGLVPEDIGKKGVKQIFKQIETLPSIGYDANKTYQMNIRKVYTMTSGKLDQGLDARLYPVTMLKNVPAGRKPIGKLKEVDKKWWEIKPKESQQYASLEDIKDTIFKQPKKEAPFTTGWDQAIGRGVTKPKRGRPSKLKIETEPRIYDSNKEFLEVLEETGIKVLNRDEMLKGKDIPAVITGSAKTDAWELGGTNYMTAIDRRGKAITIVNDEHDLLGKYGKLPGADRYMNVSEPIFVDLTLPAGKKRILSETQEATKKALKEQKEEAVDQAIKRYKEIDGVDISGKRPVGFKTDEQWARAQAVAKVQPTKKRRGLPWRTQGDYSRIVKEGAFMPMRVAKPLLGEEDRKAGGSVIERNPYGYSPRTI